MALTKQQKIDIVKEAIEWKFDKLKDTDGADSVDKLMDWLATMIVDGDFATKIKQFAQSRKAELQAIVNDTSGDIAPNTQTQAQAEATKYDQIDKQL